MRSAFFRPKFTLRAALKRYLCGDVDVMLAKFMLCDQLNPFLPKLLLTPPEPIDFGCSLICHFCFKQKCLRTLAFFAYCLSLGALTHTGFSCQNVNVIYLDDFVQFGKFCKYFEWRLKESPFRIIWTRSTAWGQVECIEFAYFICVSDQEYSWIYCNVTLF